MGRDRPTVYDVAERASVSITTVSFSYRHPSKVRPETRERVFAAAKELGYLPSGSARGLADGRTRALGLISFDFLIDLELSQELRGDTSTWVSDDVAARQFPLFVDEVQRGIELECWSQGYALLLNGVGRSDSEPIVADIAGRVDALAVFPRTVPHDLLVQLSRRLPIVELSDEAHGDKLGHVTVDNVDGARLLTEHLIEAHGLRDLQFVGPTGVWDAEQRFAGFAEALTRAGLVVPAEPLPVELLPELLAHRGLPDGLVCFNDQSALTVLDITRERDIVVPRDIAVTGFDGILAGRLARPALTTVRQPMELLGRTVVNLLTAQIDNPGASPEHHVLPVTLVLRESCGCSL